MHLRTKLVAGLAAVAISGLAAVAAGMFPGFPIVGGASYCASSTTAGVPGTASTCTSTVPAGPATITGLELIPADTQLAQGQAPQTVLIPSGLIARQGQGSSRNLLIGGDFTTNLWQRGTTPISAGTPTTATIGADRWAAYSSGNTVTVSKQTGAADIILSAGLEASMRVNRPSGTDVTDICVGQLIPKEAAAALLGRNAVFSWYGLNGAGMSATSGRVKATIAYITAADSATPLTNTDGFMKSTSTGYTNAVTSGSVGTTATVASGVATLSQSTTWTRYAVYGAIPTTATSIGVKLCYTPVGTGGATDWIEIAGAQLEAASGTAPGGLAMRLASDEALLQYRYTWGPGQEVIGRKTGVYALCVATGNVDIGMWPPVPMYIEPTTATSTLTAGTWSIQTAATVVGIGTMTLTAASSDSKMITLNSNAACTTTLPYTLVGGSGATGLILFVAEP